MNTKVKILINKYQVQTGNKYGIFEFENPKMNKEIVV